ncbi:TRAP transporter large permease subunit [Reyranella sp.]|jgi:tripartite ATP-independent transporter DctM subunit|uniref:TRAP transporter large permease n=1 Tax=Reyranella sp. TaxID=1929291 RepID=UPI0026054D8C|nr:TRAP transporter large permease subunit [Reyranella sp.]HQS14027.1 TRAP transporter large permease subunit [Reyranella sp.]HQT10512.1 TRAP transporter large permease subunit [Reyranella sp.]
MSATAEELALSESLGNPSPGGRWKWLEPINAVAALLMLGIVLLLLAGVASRYLFNFPVVWIDEVSSISFIWVAMLGSAMALDRNEHLRLTLFVNYFSERRRTFIDAFGLVVVAAVLLALLPHAVEYTMDEWFITTPALGIPNSFRVAAIPFGIVLMLVLVIRRALRSPDLRDLLVSAVVVGAIAGLLWHFSPQLVRAGNSKLLLFLVLFVSVSLACGVPIAFCFAIGTISYLAFGTNAPLSVVIGRMDEGMSSIILLSVPVFLLLGCILDATGMGKAIVDFLASWLGHIRAGMSYVLLGSLFVVSGISGSKVSDMATVAPALFPEMKRRGNKPREMIALLATGAAMADTVPPSIVLIVLGSVAGVSIAALFTSGFAIAMVLLLGLAILARWKARHEDMSGVRRPSLRVIGRTALIAAPALVLPFLIRSTVSGGVATATEVSTIAVLYAAFVGVVLYGGISLRKSYAMLVETAALTGSILLILGTASAMAWAITQAGIARDVTQFMAAMPGGTIVFMILSIVVFLILGCVLEGLPAIVLMAPLMFPIAKSLGVNDIHYAMTIVTAMNIGLMTPPIGIGFYLACRIGNVSPDEAIGAIWSYLLALMAGLAVIAAVPWFSVAFL